VQAALRAPRQECPPGLLGCTVESVSRFERPNGTTIAHTAPPGLWPQAKEVLMQVYLGIDWSQAKHDAVFLNQAGALLAQFEFQHTPDGFLRLDKARQKLGVKPEECRVGLETSHNLLVDFLWDRGYCQVYVLPPKMVNRSRERYRLSGARSDPSDAFVVADVLRTDQRRLQPWFPDNLLTRKIRAKVSLIHHITRSKVRFSNRLRAVLMRYYPAALQVFSKLSRPITLHFIQSFPTPQAAKSLTLEDFQTFARQHGHTQHRAVTRSFARLQGPSLEAGPKAAQIYEQEVISLAGLLLALDDAKKTALRELGVLFRQHPDHAIFDSLPGAGDLLAPALLAKFGDDR
jgi:transposase